jgi:hypothetical protein
MTTETPAPTETVEKPVEPTAPVVETPEEPFDKDRAMSTIQKLREIEKKAKQDAKELEQLKAEKSKREEAELSETEKLKKQAADAKAEADKLKADIMRRDVIAEVGLPSAFAERLKGDTKEAMLEDAKELAKLLPKQPTPPPHIQPTNPGGASANETDADKRARLFGSNANPFDMETVKQQGGGVVWNK